MFNELIFQQSLLYDKYDNTIILNNINRVKKKQFQLFHHCFFSHNHSKEKGNIYFNQN